jgi:hypothetical protein
LVSRHLPTFPGLNASKILFQSKEKHKSSILPVNFIADFLALPTSKVVY